jgi:hypothetical protein
MSLVQIVWKPTDRQLWQFGLAALVALPVIGWLWGAGPVTLVLLTLIGAALAGLGWYWPPALRPVYLAATIVSLPIGIVVGEIVLAATFFAVIVPMGLVFRLARRADPMQRQFQPAAGSYWQPKAQPAGPGNYLRQW